jgi:hypothetical protein
MNNYQEEEFYRQKYLKYKAKYLEAKNELEGGILGFKTVEAAKCGKYVYFLNVPAGKEATLQQTLTSRIGNENSGKKVDQNVYDIMVEIGGKAGYLEIRKAGLGGAPLIELTGDKQYKKSKTDFDTAGKVTMSNLVDATFLTTVYGTETTNGKFTFNHYFVKDYSCSLNLFATKVSADIKLNTFTPPS